MVPTDLSDKGDALGFTLGSELVAQDENDEENAQDALIDVHYLILYVWKILELLIGVNDSQIICENMIEKIR